MPILIVLFIQLSLTVRDYTQSAQQIALYSAKLDQDQPGSDAEGSDQVNLEEAQLSQSEDQLNIQGFLIAIALVDVLFLIAWIGTLINLSRGQQWAWFVLTFFFGGVMLLVYLLGGPAVPKAGKAQQRMANPSQGVPPSTPQIFQSQPTPLDILQMRLVRGEIDEQTYQRLRDTLKL